MEFPNDIMRYILEIKYYTFLVSVKKAVLRFYNNSPNVVIEMSFKTIGPIKYEKF